MPGGSLSILDVACDLPSVPSWVVNNANPPDIALDWANNRAWKRSGGLSSAASLVTVSRASSGYVNDASGNWTNVGANLPRLSNLGLLVEESRANSIRNNSMQGAVPGGSLPTNWVVAPAANLATNVVAVGTQNGIDYMDVQIVGTTDATGFYELQFEGNQIIAASNGQGWAISAFAALIAGSTANVTGMAFGYNENNAGGTALISHSAGNIAGTINSTLTRGSAILTNSNASCAFLTPFFSLNFGTSVAINLTVRIGWPQLELGASVTTPVRTTSAAVTRQADVVTLTLSLAFGSSYSLYTKGTPQAPVAYGTDQVLLQVDDGTGNNRTSIRRSAGAANPYEPSTAAGVTNTAPGSAAAWAQGVSGKIIGAMASADQDGAFGGVLMPSQVGTLPATPSSVRVGSIQSGAAQWNGFLEYSAIWASQRVPNAQLQSTTT